MTSKDDARFGEQSLMSAPGAMAPMLEGLPRALASLQAIARGLVLHYRADDPIGTGVEPSRLAEIHLRTSEAMLERLRELADRPLGAPRPPLERVVGCCRDFTLLFLTMARSVGLVARARVGFAAYFVPGWYIDHVVAEVYDESSSRWVLVDPQLAPGHLDRSDGALVDPLELERSRFLTGGDAWRACRAGRLDPERFVVEPGLEEPVLRSWPYLGHNLVHDLAALNGAEMLLWDAWGLIASETVPDAGLELCDQVAEASAGAVLDRAALARLYEAHEELAVPAIVTRFDPLGGPPQPSDWQRER